MGESGREWPHVTGTMSNAWKSYNGSTKEELVTFFVFVFVLQKMEGRLEKAL